MRYRWVWGLSLMVVAGGVLAQASSVSSAQAPQAVLSTTPASDDWSASRALPGAADTAEAGNKEVFKFKERKTPDYVNDGPKNAVNREQVLGTDKQGWKDGRPPADCSRPPISPACGH